SAGRRPSPLRSAGTVAASSQGARRPRPRSVRPRCADGEAKRRLSAVSRLPSHRRTSRVYSPELGIYAPRRHGHFRSGSVSMQVKLGNGGEADREDSTVFLNPAVPQAISTQTQAVRADVAIPT